MRPAKIQISLRIHAVWSESSLIPCAFTASRLSKEDKIEPLTLCVDVQAALRLCWSYGSFYRFCCDLLNSSLENVTCYRRRPPRKSKEGKALSGRSFAQPVQGLRNSFYQPVTSTRMVTVAFSMLLLATKTHTSFRITLMRHKNTQMQMSYRCWNIKSTIFFVEFGGWIFQQTIDIPMGTNCAPLLADLFLYSYEAEFVQSLLQAGKKQQFNFTYRYIDNVLSRKTQNLQNIWNSSIHVYLK